MWRPDEERSVEYLLMSCIVSRSLDSMANFGFHIQDFRRSLHSQLLVYIPR